MRRRMTAGNAAKRRLRATTSATKRRVHSDAKKRGPFDTTISVAFGLLRASALLFHAKRLEHSLP